MIRDTSMRWWRTVEQKANPLRFCPEGCLWGCRYGQPEAAWCIVWARRMRELLELYGAMPKV